MERVRDAMFEAPVQLKQRELFKKTAAARTRQRIYRPMWRRLWRGALKRVGGRKWRTLEARSGPARRPLVPHRSPHAPRASGAPNVNGKARMDPLFLHLGLGPVPASVSGRSEVMCVRQFRAGRWICRAQCRPYRRAEKMAVVEGGVMDLCAS